ncbi:MAG TPA: N(5)-(carboxyethyl)ornithine synthase [Planctomycetota bacterium]|nr:N(5)-(carboxyethyl)ornithine synthase [Planctomycetota bacterium]
MLSAGVIGSYVKKHEKRVPIHPEHLASIPPQLRERLVFEQGYGERFGVSDEQLRAFCRVASRDEVIRQPLVVLAKPVQADLQEMSQGATLWGWAHCVQNPGVVQAAIERKLTVMTWEGMNVWSDSGAWQSHVFSKNNEIAGYAGVLHALSLRGTTGHYGRERKAVIIHLGSVGKGALKALIALGIGNITVVVRKRSADLPALKAVRYLELDDSDPNHLTLQMDHGTRPLIEELASADVIVNAILQDTDRPLMFVREHNIATLKKSSLIVDVACDTGMGFAFARPTTFEEPMLKIGDLYYYAVDHTPSYLWESATWEISSALLPFLSDALAGPGDCERNTVLRRAVEMRDGVILNEKIATFQKRSMQYPHPILR